MSKSGTSPSSIPHFSCPTLCLSFPTRAPQPGKAGLGVQTFTPACDMLTQPHTSLRVPMGSVLMPTPPCGTVSPQGPSLGFPGPPAMAGGGTSLHPSPATRSLFLPAGIGGAEWFWQPEGPPILPSCFRPFKLCQPLLPRDCQVLPTASPVQSAALPPQPPLRGAGVSPGTAPLRGLPPSTAAPRVHPAMGTDPG